MKQARKWVQDLFLKGSLAGMPMRSLHGWIHGAFQQINAATHWESGFKPQRLLTPAKQLKSRYALNTSM